MPTPRCWNCLAALATPPMCGNSCFTSGVSNCAGASGSPACRVRTRKTCPTKAWSPSLNCTSMPQAFSADCLTTRLKIGMRYSPSTFPGCLRRLALPPGAKSWRIRSSTASATGRNWPHLSAPRDSRRDSRETYCSVRPWYRVRFNQSLLLRLGIFLRYLNIDCRSPGDWNRFNRLLGFRQLFLEAGAAEYRPALGRLEGNRSFRAALRTGGSGLRANLRPALGALCLALFAMPWVVLELLIVEE